MSFNSVKNRLLSNPWRRNDRLAEQSKGNGLKTTYLSPRELEEFRLRLVDRRRKLISELGNLQNKAVGKFVSAGGDGSSVSPISDVDQANRTWEQALTFSSIDNKRSFIREIDAALDRIEKKTYGICMATDTAISKSLLCGMPWAKYNYNS